MTEEGRHMADPTPGVRPGREYPGTPRWVKVFGIIVIVVVLLVVVVLVTGVGGEHGPGRHIPSGDAGGTRQPHSSVNEYHAPSGDPNGTTPPIEHGVQQP